jgi:hypothetical protein
VGTVDGHVVERLTLFAAYDSGCLIVFGHGIVVVGLLIGLLEAVVARIVSQIGMKNYTLSVNDPISGSCVC